jgi:histidinol-phosphatase (PHP family)
MDRSTGPRCWASFHGGHTTFGDGRGSVCEVAQAVAASGFLAFGFSEHFTMPPAREFNPDGQQGVLAGRSNWIGDYVRAVQAAQHTHAGQLSIVLGTELEYIRGAEAWTRTQLEPWPFEYFVGSVHFVRYDGEDICIDWDRARIAEALRRAGSPEKLYLDYYDHVLELLDWRIAHVVGHLDLIKILLEPGEQVDTAAIRTKVRGVLETLRDRGVAMDINARGLIKPCRSIYPADWILADAHDLGVLVTLGDDSHGPEEVGARLEQAVAALRRAGYTEMAIVRPGGVLQSAPLPGEGIGDRY